jgi:penicillin-binding protein 2
LGYKTPINIDTIMQYAKQYGLGVYTGIEIDEAHTSLPNSEAKMRRVKNALAEVLNIRADRYFKEEVAADPEQLKEYIGEIVSWAEINPSKRELLRLMAGVGLKNEMVDPVADLCKYSYYNYGKWTLADELNIAIGQGENAYTPLQMANYLATLGNEGVHNNVSLISAIEGLEVKKEPGTKVDIDEYGLSEIIRGMKLVATGANGSLRGVFWNFPVQVAAKTGTAQRSGKIHPPDEVEYIKENLKKIAPYVVWEDVEAEMERLMKERPDLWKSKNTAVRQALIELSDRRVTYEKIDEFKESYRPFAWTLAMAPADDPKIAVAVLIFQGETSLNAAPVAREVIGKYMQLDKIYNDVNLNTVLN